MLVRLSAIASVALLLALPGVAQSQQSSDGYKFLEAVKDAKGTEVEELLNKAGTTVINTRSVSNGETALHIVVKRGDDDYLRYLLVRGALPNVRDNAGVAPIVIAAGSGRIDLIETLVRGRADVNFGNSNGETALIRAVQRRNIEMVRALLAEGADPDQVDFSAGMSARDYAHADMRSPALAKLLDEAPKAKKKAAVAGPKF